MSKKIDLHGFLRTCNLVYIWVCLSILVLLLFFLSENVLSILRNILCVGFAILACSGWPLLRNILLRQILNNKKFKTFIINNDFTHNDEASFLILSNFVLLSILLFIVVVKIFVTCAVMYKFI